MVFDTVRLSRLSKAKFFILFVVSITVKAVFIPSPLYIKPPSQISPPLFRQTDVDNAFSEIFSVVSVTL